MSEQPIMNERRDVTIREGLRVGPGAPLALIAGPCALESRDLAMATAEHLVRICEPLGLPLIFKSSYEKDNRTSAEAYRGPGLDAGLRWLAEIARSFDLPVLSDVHRVEDVAAAAEVLDVVQVPALLCRQTSLLEAVGRCGRVINLKKGQFVAPAAMGGALAKAHRAGAERLLLTERGTCFGYGRLVADMPSIAALGALGWPVVFDAGHASNRREEIPLLCRCGVAAGADALFVECHPEPGRARCDGGRMLTLDELSAVVASVVALAGR